MERNIVAVSHDDLDHGNTKGFSCMLFKLCISMSALQLVLKHLPSILPFATNIAAYNKIHIVGFM